MFMAAKTTTTKTITTKTTSAKTTSTNRTTTNKTVLEVFVLPSAYFLRLSSPPACRIFLLLIRGGLPT